MWKQKESSKHKIEENRRKVGNLFFIFECALFVVVCPVVILNLTDYMREEAIIHINSDFQAAFLEVIL